MTLLPFPGFFPMAGRFPQPRCVWCGRRGQLNVGGRFCRRACASDYGVSIAQTKRWDEWAGEWTAADPAGAGGVDPAAADADTREGE